MNWLEVSNKVESIYGVMVRSENVANAVFDYCLDLGINLTYEDFRKCCYSVSQKRKLMVPTSAVMRNLHKQLEMI
jgi:hypothetical protein